MSRPFRVALSLGVLLALGASLGAQAPAVAPGPATPVAPATKLEGFVPVAGTLLTMGYDELGKVGTAGAVSVDVRELRSGSGAAVRGLVVDIIESQYRRERSFVDADEIPELLKGLDALLAITANPTSYKQFEVRYTTRGKLQLIAYNQARGDIRYSVQVGRGVTASAFVGAADLQKFRALVVAAGQKLGTAS